MFEDEVPADGYKRDTTILADQRTELENLFTKLCTIGIKLLENSGIELQSDKKRMEHCLREKVDGTTARYRH